MKMDDKKALLLNNLLADLEKNGDIKIAELRPSLSALLSKTKDGGFPGKAFLGEIVGFQAGVEMASMEDKDDLHEVDILELRDVTGDFNGETFAFNAGNGGLKAKVAKVKGLKHVLIVYRGEMERTNENWNPPKDYGMIGTETANGLAALKLAYTKNKANYTK